jgi:hypothetical protein
MKKILLLSLMAMALLASVNAFSIFFNSPGIQYLNSATNTSLSVGYIGENVAIIGNAGDQYALYFQSFNKQNNTSNTFTAPNTLFTIPSNYLSYQGVFTINDLSEVSNVVIGNTMTTNTITNTTTITNTIGQAYPHISFVLISSGIIPDGTTITDQLNQTSSEITSLSTAVNSISSNTLSLLNTEKENLTTQVNQLRLNQMANSTSLSSSFNNLSASFNGFENRTAKQLNEMQANQSFLVSNTFPSLAKNINSTINSDISKLPTNTDLATGIIIAIVISLVIAYIVFGNKSPQMPAIR